MSCLRISKNQFRELAGSKHTRLTVSEQCDDDENNLWTRASNLNFSPAESVALRNGGAGRDVGGESTIDHISFFLRQKLAALRVTRKEEEESEAEEYGEQSFLKRTSKNEVIRDLLSN